MVWVGGLSGPSPQTSDSNFDVILSHAPPGRPPTVLQSPPLLHRTAARRCALVTQPPPAPPARRVLPLPTSSISFAALQPIRESTTLLTCPVRSILEHRQRKCNRQPSLLIACLRQESFTIFFLEHSMTAFHVDSHSLATYETVLVASPSHVFGAPSC